MYLICNPSSAIVAIISPVNKYTFDNIDHSWMIGMLEERNNDRAFLRLIQIY
jgi:hypothetical protein